MPRVNRRPKKKTSGYTRDDIEYLRWGHNYWHGEGICASEELTRQAWEVFRDELLKDWMHLEPCRHTGRGGPGTRPWGWWRYDAKELRRRLNGIHPFENVERAKYIANVGGDYLPGVAKKTYFGTPSSLIIPDDFEAEYETEQGYLIRLSLLNDHERKLLAAEGER